MTNAEKALMRWLNRVESEEERQRVLQQLHTMRERKRNGIRFERAMPQEYPNARIVPLSGELLSRFLRYQKSNRE